MALTRDTLGLAMKSTYQVVNGEGNNIFKDPITDSGTKKSAKGLLCVNQDLFTKEFTLQDECTVLEELTGALKVVMLNGKILNEVTFMQARELAMQSV